jgi:spore cortex formation protein SpoVR/YcgB (stage V sporulation)
VSKSDCRVLNILFLSLLILNHISLVHPKRLGLTLVRLPDTFYLPITETMKSRIPQFVASWDAIHSVQCIVMLVSFAGSLALTQKLCDDNRVGTVRFGTHAAVQAIGTAIILYLMLTPELAISSYR